MTTPASTPHVRTARRGFTVLALVALLAQLIVPVLAFPSGALADDAEATPTVAEQPADTTAPTVAVPADITVDADPATGEAAVAFDVAADDDVDGAIVPTCDWTSGSAFPVGTTTVTCTATDTAGNTGSGTFTVTVNPAPDTTPPVFGNIPEDFSVDAADDSGAQVTYDQPTATDDVDGDVPVDCAPPSGAQFPVGSTTVTCTADDDANNLAQATFTVTVNPAPTPPPTDTPSPIPTDTPPPTDTPSPPPTDTPTPKSTAPPWIASDKDDYAPGERVHLTGGNWQPGESVHINVNDDEGQTWVRNVDVIADENGNVTDAFNLPNWFAATYKVKATGAVSGTATTAFTDGTLAFALATADNAAPSNATWSVSWDQWQGTGQSPNTTCAGTRSSFGTANYSGNTLTSGANPGINNNASAKPTNAQVTGANGSQYVLDYWSAAAAGTTPLSATQLCQAGDNGPTVFTLYAHFRLAVQTTTLTVAAASGTYGATTNLSATLKRASDNSAISGKTISFTLNGTSVGTATTNASGVATLNNASLAGIAAGTYASGAGASFAGDSSFASSNSAASLTVAPKQLTGSFTASNKVYDRTTAATIATRSLSGIVGSDDVTLANGTATFDTKIVGTGKTVTGTGFSLGGTKAANYTLASTTLTTTADITPKGLTVSGAVANDRVYDGTANATVNFGGASPNGVISGDTVSLNTASYTASFGSKTVGTGKAVTVTGVALNGTDAGNYTVAQPSGLTANIAALGISGSFTAADKIYDGTTAANVLTRSLNGVISGDTVSLTGGTANFNHKNVGAGKTVTLSGASLTGTDAGNYTLNSVGTTTASILAQGLTVTGITAQNKVYDGSVTATLNLGGAALNGVAGGDTVTLSTAGATGSFADKNVGIGKPVQVTGLTIGGADAGNYLLTQPTATADITPKGLTIEGAVANDKVYDGNANATVDLTDTSLVGVIGGDIVTIDSSDYLAWFASKDVGTNKPVVVAGVALSGADAGNYTVAQPTGLTASITRKGLTVSGITPANKTYDGTTDAALNTAGATLVGVASGDNVALDVSAAAGFFADKNVGSGKSVTVTGVALFGDDSPNYTVSQPNGLTADVTPRPITVTADAKTKTYGNGDPALTYHITSESLAFSDAFSGALTRDAGEPVGTYAIHQGTLALSSNYALTFVGANLTITKRAVTITADSQTKVYGEDDPTLTFQITSGTLAFSDTFSGSLTRAGGQNVGTYAVLHGTVSAGGNYDLTYVGNNLTITKATLVLTADNQTKVYGDASPVLTVSFSGFKNGESLGTSGVGGGAGCSTGATQASAVGTYPITCAIGSLTAGNYDFTFVAGTLTVTKAALTVTANNATKVYGAPNPAFTASYGGFVLSQNESVLGATLVFTTAASAASPVGDYAVAPSGLTSDNYNITFVDGTLAISKKALTVTADDATRVYGAANPAFTGTLIGVVNGDAITANYDSAATQSSPVGSYAIVPALADPDGKLANYTVTSTNGTLTVTPKPITVTADAQSKVYGDADPALTFQFTAGSLVGSDSFSGALTRVTGENVGTYAIQQGSLTAGSNYTLTYVGANLTIIPKAASVTPSAAGKVYGSADPALSGSLSGFLAADGVTASYSRTAGETVAGSPYAISATLSPAAMLGNYAITYNTANFTITARPITVTAENKTKLLGAVDPPLTYTVTGTLVIGDSFSGALTRDAGEAVAASPYAIKQGTLALSSNYSLTFVGGTLKILYVTTGTCLGSPSHTVLQPLNADGSSVVKKGSTVPVKFRVCDANGNSIGTPGLVTAFRLIAQSSNPGATINEDPISTTPDTAFRWDPTEQQWIFNLNTKNLNAGVKYTYLITLHDGSTIQFSFTTK
jgi:MBG domain (YGX type)/YDG domain/HYR domain